MPTVYASTLATPGLSTCSATPNTEIDFVFFKAGARTFGLQAVYLTGRGGGLTAISGIIARLARFATATTIGTGTAVTPTPADIGSGQVATATSASLPSGAGVTRTNSGAFGCGAAGPGGWVAPNPDSIKILAGGGAPSIDLLVASATASLNFEWSAEHQE
jgi:hypothetical protein